MKIKSCVITLILIFVIASLSLGEDTSVELLEHPYPYSASLTIISDTHYGPTEEFEAIHKLINTTELIRRGDPEWKTLDFDNILDPKHYPIGVHGFGIPVADTFWFYDDKFGLFQDYNIQTGTFVKNKYSSVDLEQKFTEWYEKGYVGPMHTLGMGQITRSKAEAAVNYMLKNFDRPVTVHVNHSKARTPSGVANPHCTLLNQILLNTRNVFYNTILQGKERYKTLNLPDNLILKGYLVLAIAIVLSALAFYIVRIKMKTSWTRVILLVLALSCVPLIVLQTWKVDYYKGDNRNSEYYNVDLLKKLGVRFFNTINSDYWKGTVNTIDLPQKFAATERRTIFKKYRFDDGTYGLMFLRNTINGDSKTLTLLTKKNLDYLCTKGGRTILYLHWNCGPHDYFTEEGLNYLRNLAEYRNQGKIWIAPAYDVLAHAYAYSYLRFKTERKNGVVTINLEGFDDPIHGSINAKIPELTNLSFVCRNCKDVKIKVGGMILSEDLVRIKKDGADLIVTLVPLL